MPEKFEHLTDDERSFEAQLSALTCTNHGCAVAARRGMGSTNGPCHCGVGDHGSFEEKRRINRALQIRRRQAATLNERLNFERAAHEATREKLRALTEAARNVLREEGKSAGHIVDPANRDDARTAMAALRQLQAALDARGEG